MIRKGLIWSVIALVIMLGIILWVDVNLPEGDQIPLHFDASGMPDRYGSKSEAMLTFWIIWGTTLATVALLAGLPKIMPRQSNFQKSERAYFAAWVSMLVLMVVVTVVIAYMIFDGANDRQASIGSMKFILIGMGIVFMILGNFFPKTRSNWVIGIRTPWSLSSDISWEKTHRLTGKLFIIAGLMTIMTAIFGSIEFATYMSVGTSLISTLLGVIYSWWVWRSADDRTDGSTFVD